MISNTTDTKWSLFLRVSGLWCLVFSRVFQLSLNVFHQSKGSRLWTSFVALKVSVFFIFISKEWSQRLRTPNEAFPWNPEGLGLDRQIGTNSGAVSLLPMFSIILPLFLQLNECETAPYFIQFSQNLTCNCLLILCFPPNYPKLTWAEPTIVLNIRTKQF